MAAHATQLTDVVTVTYAEEFDTLRLWNGKSGLDTRPGFAMDKWADDGFAWTGTSDTWFVQPSSPLNTAPNPFAVRNGILTISASRSHSSYSDPKGTYTYTSGVLTTFHEFSQTYGYFETRAKISASPGTLPAFWMLPTDNSWPPELDIMEVLGSDPRTLHTTVHTQKTGASKVDDKHYFTSDASPVADTSASFHTYGMDWQPDKITWYFDDKVVFQTDTPADLNKPMYLILWYNVGGNWEGRPDPNKPFIGEFSIDYMRAYTAKPGNGTIHSSVSYSLDGSGTRELQLTGKRNINATGNALDNTLIGNSGKNRLDGKSGADTLNGGAGSDTMIGGKGNDLFHVDNLGDKVVEKNETGYDTVKSSVSFSLKGQDVEVLALTGSANIDATGNSKANRIYGNGGKNTLAGKEGNDRLAGGAGKDTFVFDTKPSAANIDAIKGFNHVDDTIWLDDDIFTKLGGVPKSDADQKVKLASSVFSASDSGKAHDARDRILYDRTDGHLYYDADGSGSGKAILFADMAAKLKVDASDFVLIP